MSGQRSDEEKHQGMLYCLKMSAQLLAVDQSMFSARLLARPNMLHEAEPQCSSDATRCTSDGSCVQAKSTTDKARQYEQSI